MVSKVILAIAVLSLASVAFADYSDDLRRAFNTAQTKKFEDGLWDTTIGRESGVQLPYDCPWSSEGTEYPVFPTGNLFNVLAHGRIVVGYSEASFQYTDTNGNEFNALTYPYSGTDGGEVTPTGTFVTWFTGIINEISDHYNIDIGIKFISYKTSADALEALHDNDYDVFMGPAAHAAIWNDEPRFYNFNFACPDRAQSVLLFRDPAESDYSTYQQFVTYINANPNDVTIGVLGTGTCSTYQQIYGSKAIVKCTNTNAELAGWYNENEVQVTNVDLQEFVRNSVPFGGTSNAIRVTGAAFRASSSSTVTAAVGLVAVFAAIQALF